MMTYDETDKSCSVPTLSEHLKPWNGNIFNDEVDFDRDWLDEARRYYTNIVGKYGMQVQSVLRKPQDSTSRCSARSMVPSGEQTSTISSASMTNGADMNRKKKEL